jgi:Family of unknown function (DUF5681)
MSKQESPERVGYKHPPRAHQFQQGQSGNPSGRPRGARSLKADLRDELAELVPFREGNRALELSKQRVVIKKLVGAAIEGDARALATVLSVALRAFGEEADEHEEAPEDREILQAFASPTKTGVVGKRGKRE